MALDKQLQLGSNKKPHQIDRKLLRRIRLITRIDTQIKTLEAMKNREDITRELRRIPKWWWREGQTFFASLYYTRKPIELQKGKFSIQCQDVESVIQAFRHLQKAANDGEFDNVIDSMAKQVRENFGKAP